VIDHGGEYLIAKTRFATRSWPPESKMNPSVGWSKLILGREEHGAGWAVTATSKATRIHLIIPLITSLAIHTELMTVIIVKLEPALLHPREGRGRNDE